MAGDFSPQTIDGARPNGRIAPPALLIAVAIGLGSMDMPVPSIAEWGWSNWKFPRQVRAGETVYARWTLTQKRPHKPGDPTGVAVWRVDVHTVSGALCAEGEVGASVNRSPRQAESAPIPAPAPAPAGTAAATSRRRRGRKSPAKPAAPAPEPAPKPVEAAAAPAEKTGSRRRRRRRPKSGHGGNGQPAPDSSPEPPPAPIETASAPPAASPRGQAASPLSRVIKRLRRPSGSG